MAALGLCCFVQAFPSYRELGLLSSCSLWASHCSDFSCCRAWALGLIGFSSCSTWAKKLWFTSLVAPQHVKSSWTRDGSHVPCTGRQILMHCHQGSPNFGIFKSIYPRGIVGTLLYNHHASQLVLVVKNPLVNAGDRHGLDPWVGKNPLKKEMATHSSILAWEIPWTEELGGLQSTGS